jgi:hypothetical protein
MDKATFGFDECDGALWHVIHDESNGNIEIDSTLYRYEDKSLQPDELGFKYHVLTFKEEDHTSAEVLTAYIGDVRHFIDNHGKAGYNGVMVKAKSIPKKTIKQMFLTVLANWKFPDKTIRAVLKGV